MEDLNRPATEDMIVGRLLTFSDGVFAFALTLLVLELQPPHIASEADFWPAMIALAPKLIVFVSTFALIFVFWAAHMSTMRRLRAFDWPVLWVNGIFLLTIAVMPFASAMLGDTEVFALSWRVYCAELVAASLAQSLLVLVVMRDGGRLVGGATMRERLWRLTRSLSPGLAFAAGLAMSVMGEIGLSTLCWILIPVLMSISGLLFGPRKQKT
ncbi:MAG: TMEM175 family protein [Vitreimonas sp.]